MKKRKLIFLLPLVFSLTGCNIELSSNDFTSKLIPNWPSFVAQLGALIVLILVVIIFAYKPVKKIMDKRQEYIMKNIKDAEEAKATWQENEDKSKITILNSNKEAMETIKAAKEEANKERALILEEASKEVERMKEEAKEDIARMEKEAEEAIREEMVNIALDASKELLGREVNSSDNSRLIEEFIEDVKKEN